MSGEMWIIACIPAWGYISYWMGKRSGYKAGMKKAKRIVDDGLGSIGLTTGLLDGEVQE